MTNVLIAELYFHPTVLEQLYFLFKDKCSITFYINNDKNYHYSELFPTSRNSKIILNKLHSSSFFIGLLFFGKKFDYIYISTGPEGSHFSLIINIIFFYLCCTVYRKKIILGIKNIRPYLKSTSGLFSVIRSKTIAKLNKFVFETKSLRKSFLKNTLLSNCYAGVIYDRFSDSLPTKTDNSSIQSENSIIKVGLLGKIDSQRRDYMIILNTLKNLSLTERQNFSFIILGACPGGSHNQIIKSLSKYIKVEYVNGWLSSYEFDKKGSLCDLLISPLKEEPEYGSFKGTGAISDALYLKKRLILPYFVDTEKEFNDMAIYYKNGTELLQIFKNLPTRIEKKINPNFFVQFTKKVVFKQLIRDLNLDKGNFVL